MLTDVAVRMLVAVHALESRLRDEDGQTLAEYGLITSVVVISTILLAVIVFKDAIIGAFNRASTCLGGSC